MLFLLVLQLYIILNEMPQVCLRKKKVKVNLKMIKVRYETLLHPLKTLLAYVIAYVIMHWIGL
jgi:hypothetical protein